MFSKGFDAGNEELDGNYCRDNVARNSEGVLVVLIPVNDFDAEFLQLLGLVRFEEYPEGDGDDHVHKGPGEGHQQILSQSHYQRVIPKSRVVLELLGYVWQQISWALLEQDDTETDRKHLEAANWLSELERFVELQTALWKVLK